MKSTLALILGLSLATAACGSGSEGCSDPNWKDELAASIGISATGFTVMLSQLGTYWEDSASAHCEYERETSRKAPEQQIKANVCIFGPESDARFGCNLVSKTTVDVISDRVQALGLAEGQKAVVVVPRQGSISKEGRGDSVVWHSEAWLCGSRPADGANDSEVNLALHRAMSARYSACLAP